MASTRTTQKSGDYGVIQRGCSLIIPVEIKDNCENPIDLTGYQACFTVKPVKTDFDRHDDFCYIKKDIALLNPTTGKFNIELTSRDTDFEPGNFWFDIEIIHQTNGAVMRLCTLSFTLDGGPSNRYVNPGLGQLQVGDSVSIVALAEGAPIVIITPTLTLDSQVFSQVASLMGIVDQQKSTIEELETTLKDMDDKVKALTDKIEELQDTVGIVP